MRESRFCSACGKDQTVDIITLEQIHVSWKKMHYRKISEKGKEGYTNAWRRLQPLAHRPAVQLELEDFQNILDEMLPTSHSNQEKLQQLIGQLCKHSFLTGNGLRLNYAAYLILEGYRSKESLIFSDSQIVNIWEYALKPSNQYYQAARVTLCLIFTGLRPNELFNVSKHDINTKHQYFIASGSKTTAGKNRIIPLIPIIWPFIAEWFLAAPISTNESPSYLLTGPKGARYSLTNWRAREFYPLMLELEINKPSFYEQQKHTPYSSRHTYVSLAFRAGVEKELLKKMVGHTNWNFTTDTYVHAQIMQYQVEMGKVQDLAQHFMQCALER